MANSTPHSGGFAASGAPESAPLGAATPPGPPQVDSVLPRAKAVFHALTPAAAYLAGPSWATWILGFTCLAMALSVLLGPRFSLFGRLVRAIRPYLKLSPGKPESLAPHRFAEAVGAVFLGTATAAYATGFFGIGATLALIVVALAVLNAAAGICVGCQLYLVAQRFRPAPAPGAEVR